jgi:hypothetical protein
MKSSLSLAVLLLCSATARAQGAATPAPPASQARAAAPATVPPGTSLYDVIGRPDLAEAERERASLRAGLITGGLIAWGGGLVWGMADLLTHAFVATAEILSCELRPRDPYPASQRCEPSSPNAVPWLIGGAGAVVTIAGLGLSADPLSPAERESLIRDYQRRVQTTPRPKSASPAKPLSLDLSAAVGPAGGMMILHGRF